MYTPHPAALPDPSVIDPELSAELESEEADGTPPIVVESQNLLGGRKSVCIRHNGSLYRLQATKLGKLILTK